MLLLLLVLALLWRRRWPVWLALCLFWLGSTPWFSDHLLRKCEAYAIRQPVSKVGNAHAIVVLSESRTLAPGPDKTSEWNDGDRFWSGIELYQAKKAPWLILTNGWVPWRRELAPEGEVLKELANSQNIPASAIQVTAIATNTAEEAAAVAALMPKLSSVGSSNPKTILLVTSAFHMPRAQQLFEQAGLNVLPYPVDFKVSARDTFTAMDLFPSAGAWQRTEMAWRELLGRAYYRIKIMLGHTKFPENKVTFVESWKNHQKN